MAQQQGANLHPVLGRRLVERSELPQVHGVHTGSVLQREPEQRISFDAAFTDLHARRCSRQSELIEQREDPCESYFEQELCDLKVSIGAGVVKRNEAAAGATIRNQKSGHGTKPNI